MHDRAVDDALEAGRGLSLGVAVDDEIFQVVVQIVDQLAAKEIEIDVAGAHDCGRIAVVDQRQEQVLERCVLVTPLIGEFERAVE